MEAGPRGGLRSLQTAGRFPASGFLSSGDRSLLSQPQRTPGTRKVRQRNSIEQFEFAHRIFSRGGNIEMRDPFTAGILSLLIPGVGQLYNGRILAGILWLIITPGFWIGTGGTLGWVCHIIAAYTAYSYAKDHPIRT